MLPAGCGGDGADDALLGAPPSSDIGGDTRDETGDETGDPENPQPGLEPGQLTAAEWDDNDYFDFFLQTLYNMRTSSDNQLPNVNLSDRTVITVTDAERTPIPGATVTVLRDGDPVFSAPTATDGRLLFFPAHDQGLTYRYTDGTYAVEIIEPGGNDAVFDVSLAAQHWDLQLEAAEAATVKHLDLAFVIDATGSMSDELEYIKTEIIHIVSRTQVQHSDVAMRFALIVYRDEGDDYITRVFDFDTDLRTLDTNLGRQSAAGGGDYPEAMDTALEAMNDLEWQPGPVARIAFLIADAPPHRQRTQRFLDTVDVARRAGIKLYPIAASGVAQEAEYLMRIAAQQSLGRYLFLTDDSGIGNPHEEPRVPCYQVEHLNELLIRTILSELRGAYLAPDPDSILRTVGQYRDNRCVITSTPDPS